MKEFIIFIAGFAIGCLISTIIYTCKKAYGVLKVDKIDDENIDFYVCFENEEDVKNLVNKNEIVLKVDSTHK